MIGMVLSSTLADCCTSRPCAAVAAVANGSVIGLPKPGTPTEPSCTSRPLLSNTIT